MRKALLVFPVVAIVMAPTVASANCPGLLGSGGVYDILCTQGAGGGSDAGGDRATGGGGSSTGSASASGAVGGSTGGSIGSGTTGGASGGAGNAGNAGGLGVGDSGHKIANLFKKLFVKEAAPTN